jgi:teichuronic acid exporter
MSVDTISKTNTAVKYSLVFKGGQQVVALVMGIILARLLSPNEFGVIAIVNMIVYYANSFTNFGLNNALIQNSDINEDHINTVFTIDFFISTFLCLLTFISADYIGLYFNNASVALVLKWMSLYYLITTFHSIPIVLLRKKLDYAFLTILEFFEALITSVFAIYLATLGYSYWSIVISSLAVQALTAIVLMFKTHWLPKFMIGKDMADLYSFGLWNFIRAQLDLLVSKVDYFVIGRFLGVYTLGIYEKSFELTGRAMSGISMPINGVFFPVFSRIKDDVKMVRHVFLQASSMLALICYPILLGLVSVAPNFVISCLGPQWKGAIVPIQVLAIASMFKVLFGMVANVNVVVGKYRKHTKFQMVSSLIFVALCFMFVSYGVLAISYAYVFFCMLLFISSFSIAATTVDISLATFIKAIWCPLLGSVIMFFIVVFLRLSFWHDYSSFLHLFFLVISGASFYICWILFFYNKGVVSFRISEYGATTVRASE